MIIVSILYFSELLHYFFDDTCNILFSHHGGIVTVTVHGNLATTRWRKIDLTAAPTVCSSPVQHPSWHEVTD
jgi:hypothetical protein